MAVPPNGRPDSSVNPGTDFELAQSFNLLIDKVEALTNAVEGQTSVMERTASAEARYKVTGLKTRPQFTSAGMETIRRSGTMHGLQGETSAMPGLGALSSLQNLQAFGAQQLGSWLYGSPLFESPGGGAGGSATPAGTPNSTTAPAGQGAQLAAAAGAAVTGGGAYAPGAGGRGSPPGGGGSPPPAPPGGPPGSGGLGGLPGMVFGSQGPQSAMGQRGLATMQLLGARVAMSGGSPGGISSALRNIPGVGLLTDLYNKGFNTFQGAIYQPGRYYQQIEGGSALGGTQFERLHQAVYQASMAFTPMGASAAGQAFNAVTSLGYNRAAQGEQQYGGQTGQDRMGALNFIYQNYTATGMPVQQSVQVLQTASQNATIALQNVSQALKGLSADAGQAGTNANQARQAFQQYFQTAVTQGAGPGAPALAGAVAATQASYGKQFAGTNFSGELSMTRQYLLAGQYGITPGQAQYLQRTNPGAYLGMMQGQNVGWIQQLGIPQADIQALQQMIQQAGGAGAIKLNPDLVNQIANNWLNTDQWAMNNANLDIWAQMLSSLTGISLTSNTVMPWIVQQLAGNGEAANQVAPGSTRTAAAASATVSASSAASGSSRARTGQYGLAQGTPQHPASGRAGMLGMMVPSQSWQHALASKSGSAAQAYLAEEKRSGRRSPVLEALLQNLSQGDMVQVQTRTGPRVMNLTDAMKYYPDELMAGNVMFFNSSGKALGTTTQITRGLSVPGENVSAEQGQAAGSHLGVSQKAWQKAHLGAYTSASLGKGVTVTLSKEAQQLLKLLPANSDTASAMGTAPSPPWPSISSR